MGCRALWRQWRKETENTQGLECFGRSKEMQVLLYMTFFAAFTWFVVTVQNQRRLMAVTLAGVMVVTLVGAPQPAQAQLGILQAIQAVLNVINGVIQSALTSINTVRTAVNNLQQLVVWPQQLINQARAQVTQMIGQYRNLMTNIFHIKLNSATLPNPQALEAVIRDHQVNNFVGLTGAFANTYGAIPVATAANPGDRAMSDMDDALALDNLKTLKAGDQATDIELQSADTIENSASQAAPGSAPFLTATAITSGIHAQALRESYANRQQNPPVLENMEIVVALVLMAVCWFSWYVAHERYNLTNRQIAEVACYLALGGLAIAGSAILIATARSRREKQWPHLPMVVSRKQDEQFTSEAWKQDAVVLGYDIHGKPWYWPDRVRVMQGIVLGMTGSGKTTLLKNIITQDMARVVGTPKDPHRLPMVIFDGKGDLEFFYDLLPHVHRAGRLHQLRVLNPARPDISVRYNPFYCSDEDYMEVVNMVFGSFNLHDEFFAKHQLNYLADIVRVLVYTGRKINVYDVLVAAIDEQVLREQVEKARQRLEHDPSIP